MIFGCKHKYGVITDGYQYCDKCGVAKAAPKTECGHKWKTINNLTESHQLTGRMINYIYVLQCSNCGEIKKVTT